MSGKIMRVKIYLAIFNKYNPVEHVAKHSWDKNKGNEPKHKHTMLSNNKKSSSKSLILYGLTYIRCR